MWFRMTNVTLSLLAFAWIVERDVVLWFLVSWPLVFALRLSRIISSLPACSSISSCCRSHFEDGGIHVWWQRYVEPQAPLYGAKHGSKVEFGLVADWGEGVNVCVCEGGSFPTPSTGLKNFTFFCNASLTVSIICSQGAYINAEADKIAQAFSSGSYYTISKMPLASGASQVDLPSGSLRHSSYLHHQARLLLCITPSGWK